MGLKKSETVSGWKSSCLCGMRRTPLKSPLNPKCNFNPFHNQNQFDDLEISIYVQKSCNCPLYCPAGLGQNFSGKRNPTFCLLKKKPNLPFFKKKKKKKKKK